MSNYGWHLWLVVGGMAFVTILNRAGLILLSGRFTLPPGLQASLRYAPEIGRAHV